MYKGLTIDVLIVAKCIVNFLLLYNVSLKVLVLIVAKCIVNIEKGNTGELISFGINSSKVYCKSEIIQGMLMHICSINSSKVYCKS